MLGREWASEIQPHKQSHKKQNTSEVSQTVRMQMIGMVAKTMNVDAIDVTACYGDECHYSL